MVTPPRPLLLLLAAGILALPVHAQSPAGSRSSAGNVLLAPVGVEQMLAAARAADDERLAATKAGDPARLNAIFSDDLRYAHSSGKVDTKTSYTRSLTTHSTVYESFDYLERNFKVAGPGIVLMSGRVVIHSRNDGQPVVLDLNFLAVWREEGGRWRFLAWQSCKNPPPAPPAK
jgi:ketosteroid isomerase-like protein